MIILLSDEEEMDEDNVSNGTGELYTNMEVENTEDVERTNSTVLNADVSDVDTSV